MKKIIKSIILIISITIIIFSLTSCKKEEKVVTPKDKFEIYMATFESVKEYGFYDYKNLVLLDKPIITDEDIRAYYWINHEIEVTSTYMDKILREGHTDNSLYMDKGNYRQYEKGGSKILNSYQYDCFVVVVNGVKIYSGTFPYSPIFSYQQEKLIIGDVSDTSFKIIFKEKDGLDPRNSDAIYNFFKKQGKLRVNDVNNLEGRITELEDNITKLINEKAVLESKNEVLQNDLKKLKSEKNSYKNSLTWLEDRVYWYMKETTDPEITKHYSDFLLGQDFNDIKSINIAGDVFRKNITINKYDNDRLFNLFETYYYATIKNLENTLVPQDITEKEIHLGIENGIKFSIANNHVNIYPIKGYLKDNYGDFLTGGTNKYLDALDYESNIMNKNNVNTIISNDKISIPLNEFVDIILYWEDYSYNYGFKLFSMPFRFKGSEKLLYYFNIYSGKVLLKNSLVYNENKKLSDDFHSSYLDTIKRYPDSETGKLITELLDLLTKNGFSRDINIEEFYHKVKFNILFD